MLSHATVGDLTVVPLLVPVRCVAPRSVHVTVRVPAALTVTSRDFWLKSQKELKADFYCEKTVKKKEEPFTFPSSPLSGWVVGVKLLCVWGLWALQAWQVTPRMVMEVGPRYVAPLPTLQSDGKKKYKWGQKIVFIYVWSKNTVVMRGNYFCNIL